MMLKELKTDIDRYTFGTKYSWLLTLLTRQGLWIMTQYRLSRWLKFKFKVPVIRQILRLLLAIEQKLMEIITNSELPNTSEIGKGLYMPHAFGIIIHCDAKIGEYCNLGQQVTIGLGGRGEKAGVPIIGDRVFIGPGAKIFGKIIIGNNVAIGANAVVTKDVPDNAVVVGVPAKIISYEGSESYIAYPSKEL